MSDLDSPLDPPAELPPSPDPGSLIPAERGAVPERGAAHMRNTRTVGIVMLILGVLLGYYVRPTVEGWLNPESAQTGTAVIGPRPLPQTQSEVMPYLIAQTRHFKGDENAPVTVIEFADFQCPYCGLFARDAARRIDEQYVASGRVRFGYQHFTFLGPESQWAAEASECAADQDRFWAYHDLLFASQQGENQGAFNKDNLKQFASTVGLDRTLFDNCLDSGKYTALVSGQTHALSSLGVSSTPTFVVNGQAVVGAQSFESFQQVIDQELGK